MNPASAPSASIPRAATSVATRIRSRPLLKDCITWVRMSCFMSPCSPAALKPLRLRYSVSSSTIFLVLQNTTDRLGSWYCSSRFSTSILAPEGVR